MRIYIKYWFECSVPTKAAVNDLKLYKELIEYEEIDKPIADAVIQVLSRHLWYLSETLVGLAFFNDYVSLAEKRLMVAALENPGYDENPKKAIISKERVNQLRLCDFVTENTKYFFNAVCESSSQEFLEMDPESWNKNNNYLSAKEKVEKMLIVNDVAERAIALASSFNDKITKKEDEKQLLFQVIERYREEFPNKLTKSQMKEKL